MQAFAGDEWRIAYLATGRPLEAVKLMRPLLNAIQNKLSDNEVNVKLKSDVVRQRDNLDFLIKKKRVDIVRCESVYCMGLLQKMPTLQIIGLEAGLDSLTQPYYFVVKKGAFGDDPPSLKGKRLLFGEHFSSGEDYLAKVKLVREGYTRVAFDSVGYEPNGADRLTALLKGETDATVLNDEIYQKNKDQLQLLWQWESIPYIWLATQNIGKTEIITLKSVLPQVSDKFFNKQLGTARFVTEQLPDLLPITEAWHVSWLFNEASQKQ